MKQDLNLLKEWNESQINAGSASPKIEGILRMGKKLHKFYEGQQSWRNTET